MIQRPGFAKYVDRYRTIQIARCHYYLMVVIVSWSLSWKVT